MIKCTVNNHFPIYILLYIYILEWVVHMPDVPDWSGTTALKPDEGAGFCQTFISTMTAACYRDYRGLDKYVADPVNNYFGSSHPDPDPKVLKKTLYLVRTFNRISDVSFHFVNSSKNILKILLLKINYFFMFQFDLVFWKRNKVLA